MTASDVAKRSAGLITVAHQRLRPRREPCVAVLTYHRTAPTEHGDDASLNTGPRRFHEQLHGLQREGWSFVGVDDLLAWGRGDTELPERTVAVTFDDGYTSNVLHAVPVLRELAIPATFFVTTGFVDSLEPFPFDPRRGDYGAAPVAVFAPMTTDDLHELSVDELFRLGSHTHFHLDYRVRLDDLRSDLESSATALNGFQPGPLAFAFPFGVEHRGFASDEMARVVRELGFTTAFTTTPRPLDRSAPSHRWGRINVYGFDTATTLAAKLEGHHGWVPALQHRLARLRQLRLL